MTENQTSPPNQEAPGASISGALFSAEKEAWDAMQKAQKKERKRREKAAARLIQLNDKWSKAYSKVRKIEAENAKG